MREIKLGKFVLGGNNPIRVQSMCNTDTRDVLATIKQIQQLEKIGCEINRIAVPDMDACRKIAKIKAEITNPLVADIHFDHKLALEAIKQGIDKIRINPGNIGDAEKVKDIVKACKDRKIPIRIGVNAGSLKAIKNADTSSWSSEKYADIMVQEAIEEINILEQLNFKQVLVSLKADDLNRTVLACKKFAKQMPEIPQHIGLTEAGSFIAGSVKSAIAMSELLRSKIGATIRVSLTESPILQVRTAYEILKTLGLREYGPNIISCPTCGRCEVDVASVVKELEDRIYNDPELLKKSTGKKIAVMGCIVNGPGEAKESDFGIAGGKSKGIFFEAGKQTKKLSQKEWISTIINKIKE
ncbi:MAG: flavodoxin-dependent (E)-4-hydroxy-3-methylbut-2-enyl-diphosphate synthase [Elusimicrobiaceae bacterium]|jgi:(E)-4-hydroxy-3-methylbut-2-enyl-diphosphate synthase|nr:flavodoxin-dependent (E)-4-hydroxy-3-methylbut-2-enyl-diphosphate synthase [Elusimicrobiaceae bacterium]MBT3955402.1 flavodoxin-dependent (E)-4-hydroxy-3-methylbut-2-enyl-diphosphate synthase [Elusimicrobiaceae bacterium]MBT4007679.1 flavodoxin-dependent (E)-4-hydroxy-3-methylbut-2-enyl-diphosphate synthase [Elusimicrobiaceae bacterium]MBT4402311.1 flavodoxin-dependent (E)-4-hydroxy-3-methylbut-2-enyl-diphosphate synthase [Elusimicrobiaceae bacterium]MBT4439544.1 flavodoxin-dependent (E)-4-h